MIVFLASLAGNARPACFFMDRTPIIFFPFNIFVIGQANFGFSIIPPHSFLSTVNLPSIILWAVVLPWLFPKFMKKSFPSLWPLSAFHNFVKGAPVKIDGDLFSPAQFYARGRISSGVLCFLRSFFPEREARQIHSAGYFGFRPRRIAATFADGGKNVLRRRQTAFYITCNLSPDNVGDE